MAIPLPKRVAASLRDARKAQGLSTRELARRSGVAPEIVSRTERLMTEVTLGNLEKLCRGLGLDVTEIVGDAPRKSTASDPETRRVLAVLGSIEPRARAGFVAGLEALAQAFSGDGALLLKVAEKKTPYRAGR